ncbi:MAG: hypothetical protein M3421_00110, partial [Bacteroidota bacterium]|nr:hypothetical protein [Bacteroidota bacterium]
MKKTTFCTVVTFNYLPYALALHHSINQFGNYGLCIFISDKKRNDLSEHDQTSIANFPPNIRLFYLEELLATGIGENLYSKYVASDMDCFRWSMKPVFIKFLIENENYEKIIYGDSDLFFFDDPQFLFNELDTSDILLTPHWRSSDPLKDKSNFDHLFVAGIFNAGFIGVNSNGKEAMAWWANVCLYQCIKDTSIGQFVDQTYLNLFPVLFAKVHILRHKGCNVANWNTVDCPRTSDGNKVLIENKWPIVFIHFTKSTLLGIHLGYDPVLKPYLEEYI